MCPACMANVALLIGSAVSSGGVAAVLVNKLLTPKGEKSLAKSPKKRNEKENIWARQRTSK